MSGKIARPIVKKQQEPEFANQLEELEYWRSKYEDKEKELLELEESFTDFQQSSKDLEAEMERELTTNEKKLKDITSLYHRLKSEHDEMMEKSRRVAEDSGKMIHNLQDEAEALKKSNKELRREKQRLEQENDELERRVRESEASLQDLTEKMNKTLEENSLLQTELEETKNRSQETIQRMKDEIRDLKLEMAVSNSSKLETQPAIEREIKTNGIQKPLPKTTESSVPSPRNGAISPSRLSKTSEGSIDLVDDILVLVKDMERKLLLQKMDTAPKTSLPELSFEPIEEEEY